jgi:hypothetical protein
MTTKPTEPEPLLDSTAFEEWDFEALAPQHARSSESNEHRLRARRKLLGLAKVFARDLRQRSGLALEARTSLHNPHAFNGNKVQRLWAYLMRPKAEKTRLRKVLGRDLAKDLDQAYRNAYLCIGLEHELLEVSLRIHPDAWFDGQNLIRRVEAEGVQAWLAILNRLDGFQLRLHDWKGEWLCGALTPEALQEFLRFYTPGEHQLVVDRRWPVPAAPGARAAACGPKVPGTLLAELARLEELYRFAVWSEESDFLFAK